MALPTDSGPVPCSRNDGSASAKPVADKPQVALVLMGQPSGQFAQASGRPDESRPLKYPFSLRNA